MNEHHFFLRRMLLIATLIVAGMALALPGFTDQPHIQFKIAIAIPCILAGAWSLPPLLVKLTNALVATYERFTGRQVRD